MNKNEPVLMSLIRAFDWFDEALQIGLRAHGWDNVSRSQSLVLIHIATGVQRASELARQVGVTRQAMSQMLAELEQKGLVHLKADPTDGRARIVTFSGRSASMRGDAMRILAELEVELGKRIGAVRLNTLRGALGADWGSPPMIKATGRPRQKRA